MFRCLTVSAVRAGDSVVGTKHTHDLGAGYTRRSERPAQPTPTLYLPFASTIDGVYHRMNKT